MNCNFFQQPACYQIPNDIPTNYLLDQSCLNFANNTILEPSYEELKKKCLELELENNRLKQELSQVEQSKVKKGKRIVKRRKQEDLQKAFRCSLSNCKKQYASSLALNLHIKTKHFLQKQNKRSNLGDQFQSEKNSLKQQGENSNLADIRTLLKDL